MLTDPKKKFSRLFRLENDKLFPYFSRLRRNPAQIFLIFQSNSGETLYLHDLFKK